jgi:hypothetical protein
MHVIWQRDIIIVGHYGQHVFVPYRTRLCAISSSIKCGISVLILTPFPCLIQHSFARLLIPTLWCVTLNNGSKGSLLWGFACHRSRTKFPYLNIVSRNLVYFWHNLQGSRGSPSANHECEYKQCSQCYLLQLSKVYDRTSLAAFDSFYEFQNLHQCEDYLMIFNTEIHVLYKYHPLGFSFLSVMVHLGIPDIYHCWPSLGDTMEMSDLSGSPLQSMTWLPRASFRGDQRLGN